jgi:hypothetical protein
MLPDKEEQIKKQGEHTNEREHLIYLPEVDVFDRQARHLQRLF